MRQMLGTLGPPKPYLSATVPLKYLSYDVSHILPYMAGPLYTATVR